MGRAESGQETLLYTGVDPGGMADEKISVAEAKAAHPGISDERVTSVPELAKPFGQSREREALKAAIKPGDEIWTFAAPADDWKNLAGRAGVALVWDGHPIVAVAALMN